MTVTPRLLLDATNARVPLGVEIEEVKKDRGRKWLSVCFADPEVKSMTLESTTHTFPRCASADCAKEMIGMRNKMIRVALCLMILLFLK